ncbi:MAG: hypothetical protein D6729_10035 [Deltaproteobacteria bacterium]|nr:MAG: hypothetical protein D6729_10035 [Deltaproteobacteria bacterium]
MRAHGLLLVMLVGLAACRPPSSQEPEPPAPPWSPGTVYPTARSPSVRGYLDRRGLIHAHSVYSHDACDGEPRDPETDAIDEQCLDDFRQGLCATQHDFIFLSDHSESFARSEFPDVLLHRASEGDVLLEREGRPVANWLHCQSGWQSLVMAGAETKYMPVGLERHVSDSVARREEVYGSATPEHARAVREAGGVVLVAHTEDWTAEELASLPIDGFEMYNTHANLFLRIGEALQLIADLDTPEVLPHPDLVFLPLWSEDPRYVDTWGQVLSRGVRRVTTLGTDCHRNTFRDLLPDGERIDSYRRMMLWFSNHLLVRPNPDGGFDDRALKEALRAGRLYGAFEYLGYPVGFDFHAEAGSTVTEMGGTVSLSDAPRLVVAAPTVQNLDPAVRPPEIEVRLLRATESGWEEVAREAGDLSVRPEVPGAYRAEVRMRPYHLLDDLGAYDERALDERFVWIYANPIYVAP